MARIITPEERAAGQLARQGAARRRAEEAEATVDALRADAGPLPGWAERHAAKARKGNLRSLVALKCGDCACWQRAEVAACPVTTCPLHPIRPYRR
jgi:hypothetical protein